MTQDSSSAASAHHRTRVRTAGACAALIVVAVAALAWLRREQPGPEPAAPTPVEIVAAHASSNLQLDREDDDQASAWLADLPDSDLPPSQRVPELLVLAGQGRADAMHTLAMNLLACRRALTSTDDSVRRDELRRFYARYGREPSTDRELDRIAAGIERLALLRERCAGIEVELAESGLEWLEKAALAGDTEAMLEYSRWALSGMRDANTLLENFDEVARRRELAGRFLHQALARGDCRALGALASAYAADGGGRQWIFTADPYLAVVYTEAQIEASRRPGTMTQNQERRWLWLANDRGDSLDPARRDAARRQGEQLVRRHCGG